MLAGKLAGGRVRKTDRNRIWLSPQAKEPQMRLGTPGNLQLSVGCYTQYAWCAQQQTGVPEPTKVHIFFYEMEGADYLVLAVPQADQKPDEDPDVYELKFERGPKSPDVRGLQPLLLSVDAQVRQDRWYYMKTVIMEVEGFGPCVVGNWTKAEAVERTRGDGDDDAQEEAAVTEEPQGEPEGMA